MRLAFEDRLWFFPQGSLTVTKVSEGGVRTPVLSHKNIVVDQAREMLAKSISGFEWLKLTHIALGDGVDPDDVQPPTPDETELANELIRIPIEVVQYPSFNSVLFRAFLRREQGSGMEFTEAGLMAGETGKMFAKRNHLRIPKDEDFLLEYEWVITF